MPAKLWITGFPHRNPTSAHLQLCSLSLRMQVRIVLLFVPSGFTQFSQNQPAGVPMSSFKHFHAPAHDMVKGRLAPALVEPMLTSLSSKIISELEKLVRLLHIDLNQLAIAFFLNIHRLQPTAHAYHWYHGSSIFFSMLGSAACLVRH
jgi:hypothetical protein